MRRTRPIGPAADRLLARWHDADQAEAGPILEDVVVVEAIRLSGVDTGSRSKGNGDEKGFDIAVWSEDLEPWVTNPLLIEIRATINSEAALQATAQDLFRAMGSTGVRWSLLIYGHSPTAPERVIGVPNVLAISAESFLRGLADSSFCELVRKLRNERVHGVC